MQLQPKPCVRSDRGWVGFSVDFAHQMIAGCDIILMPSRFEPCGLNQLFAMRYGTVPIAHATGGLRDTISEFNPFAEGKSPHDTSPACCLRFDTKAVGPD